MARTSGVQPTSLNLRITLTGGDKNKRTLVKVLNRSTGEFQELVADENSVSFNLADLSSDGTKDGTFSGFSNNDVLNISCHGSRFGGATHTVNTDTGTRGNSVTMATVNVTSTNTLGLVI